MIGAILGERYEILEVVGSGGMAIVYKAKDKLLDRFVAVKMLREELQGDREFIERFKAEARSAASLNHPNIVSVFDVGTEGDREYFVMEYIEGVTLKEIITGNGMNWKTACSYGVQIAGAIEHAHKKNIVHRDIKPHNIMITKDKVVKVTDFGIARAVTSSTIVRAGNVIGSVHYFSPEQASGGVVNAKSDIYSMGVVLYEMLTGRVPFDAENPIAIAKMHVDDPVRPVTEIRPDIPESVSSIVLKAMKKQPSKRYQRSDELAADLKMVIANPDSLSIKDKEETQFIPVVKPADKPAVKPEIKVEIKPETKKESHVVVTDPEPEDTGRRTSAKIAWIVTILVFLITAGIVCATIFPIFSGKTKTVEVPDLRNMTIEQAEEICEEAGFELAEPEYEYSDAEEGIIIKQTPAPSMYNKKIEKITVTVSKGPEGKREIKVESYVGQKGDDAVDMIEQVGLKAIVKTEFDKDEEPGTVLRQEPSNGTILKEGESVTIYINEEKEVVIPDVVGKTKSEAKKMLEDAELQVEIKIDYDKEKTLGIVLRQSPSEETTVSAGSKVTIYVNEEKEATYVVMPNIVGLTKDQAEDMLDSVGLEVGEILEEETEKASEIGKVLSQRRVAGTNVKQGTKINLTIGVKPKEEPSEEEPSDNIEEEETEESGESEETSEGAMSR